MLTLGQCLPLAVRRRWPSASLAVVACCFAFYQALGYPANLAGVGVFVALYSAGAHAERFRRPVAVATTVGYVALAVTLAALHSPGRTLDYVTFFVLLAGCWGSGAWVRGWRAGEAARQRAGTAAALARERARIARELHDVVTHHVTAMVIQADAAKYLVEGAPERAVDGLGAISGTGRQALAELRELLGVLDTPGSAAGGAAEAPGGAEGEGGMVPGPRLGGIHDLVERMRRAGQPVDLVENGERTSLVAAPGLAAYRVVQEALTNAVKHAPGRRTVVRVGYGEELHIDVTTDGPVAPPAGATGGGRGLVGLRERVSACGGELTAGVGPGGGFRVRATIPSGTSDPTVGVIG